MPLPSHHRERKNKTALWRKDPKRSSDESFFEQPPTTLRIMEQHTSDTLSSTENHHGTQTST